MTVRVWIDGSCRSGMGRGGWGMIALLPDGRLLRRAGAIGDIVSSTDSEIIALREAIESIGTKMNIEVRTDCKALADAINGAGNLAVPLWEAVRGLIESRGLAVTAKWVRKRSSGHMRAAHYLANAARVFGEIGGGSLFEPEASGIA